MGLVRLSEQTPPNGVAGYGRFYVDSITSKPFFVDDAGRHWPMAAHTRSSIAAQGAGFATDTYVTDSGILIPGCGLQVGTQIEWLISADKTAASTAQPTYTFRVGAAQTTADAAIDSVQTASQTAAIDVGVLRLMLTVRSIGAAGVIAVIANWSHTLGTATGFGGSNSNTLAALDMTSLAGKYLGVSINGGTSSAWTIRQVQSRAFW